MKIVVADDEMGALNSFLYNIVDEMSLEYKMFYSEPLKITEYVKNNRVDCAFLDINMPQIDGITLAERLLAVCPTIKLVFITAFTYSKDELEARFGESLVAVCEKPFDKRKLQTVLSTLNSLIDKVPAVRIKTFGLFDVFVNNSPLIFPSAKSKELLALLVMNNGSVVPMGEVIANLWADKNAENSKILYRDAVWRLRKFLCDCSLSGLVEFSRASCRINTSAAECDYWSYLTERKPKYGGNFMTNYGWAVETEQYLISL